MIGVTDTEIENRKEIRLVREDYIKELLAADSYGFWIADFAIGPDSVV